MSPHQNPDRRRPGVPRRGSAIAGGFAQEVVEAPVVVVEPEAETSSWGIILPLAALGLWSRWLRRRMTPKRNPPDLGTVGNSRPASRKAGQMARFFAFQGTLIAPCLTVMA